MKSRIMAVALAGLGFSAQAQFTFTPPPFSPQSGPGRGMPDSVIQAMEHSRQFITRHALREDYFEQMETQSFASYCKQLDKNFPEKFAQRARAQEEASKQGYLVRSTSMQMLGDFRRLDFSWTPAVEEAYRRDKEVMLATPLPGAKGGSPFASLLVPGHAGVAERTPEADVATQAKVRADEKINTLMQGLSRTQRKEKCAAYLAEPIFKAQPKSKPAEGYQGEAGEPSSGKDPV
jgi:hypothetical protein